DDGSGRSHGSDPTGAGGTRAIRVAPRSTLSRPSGRDARELRDDLAPVGLERLFLSVRHQVDVELVDADGLELAQLLRALLGVADDAEALADLVGDELSVLRADARVILVVVSLARLHEVGQLRRDVRIPAVLLDQ